MNQLRVKLHSRLLERLSFSRRKALPIPPFACFWEHCVSYAVVEAAPLFVLGRNRHTAMCVESTQSCTEDKMGVVLAQQFELQRQMDMIEWSESFLRLQRSVLPPADYLAAW